VREVRRLVQRDQVDLASQLNRDRPERDRVFVEVGLSPDQHVFDHDAPAAQGQFPQRGDQVADRIGPVDRHPAIALLVGCAGHRNGDVRKQRFPRKAFQLGDQPHGGERDPVHRHVEAGRIVEDSKRLHHVVVVVKRFTHAHQHDVEVVLEAGAGDIVPPHEHHLADDFRRREVPGEPELPGETESAGKRAPDLGGHADRVPVSVGDVHGFRYLAVAEGDEVTPCSVGRIERPVDAGKRGIQPDREVGTHRLRQVRDLADVGDFVPVDGFEKLRRPERAVEPLRHLLAGHSEERGGQ
jgi:hypothetical protein